MESDCRYFMRRMDLYFIAGNDLHSDPDMLNDLSFNDDFLEHIYFAG